MYGGTTSQYSDTKTDYLSGYAPAPSSNLAVGEPASETSTELGGGRQFVIRARGLPWSVTDDEIAEFFEPEIVLRTREQIHRVETNGRFSGEIYLELYTREEEVAAIAKNKNTIGKRYVEVYPAKIEELKRVLEHVGEAKKENILKLRGLPFHVRREEIQDFLQGCELKGAGDGIHFVPDKMGRGTCNGEAFVEMADDSSMEKALAKNKQNIGSRWIEVFRSTKSEMESIIYPDEPLDSYPAMYSHDIDLYGQPPMYGMRGRPPPPHMYPGGPGPYGPPPHGYGPPPGPGFKVKMQGLPYESTRHDIVQFFHPAEVLFLEFVRDNNGRITDCVVEFGNERDHQLALSRHKQNLGRRYVEVYNYEDDEWYPPPPPPPFGGPRPFYPPPIAEFRVQLRGTPFDVTNAEIYSFFGSLKVTGVEMCRDKGGKVQDVFVSLASPKDLEGAIKLNKQNIRHRYVEVYDACGGMGMSGGGGPMRRARPPMPPRGGEYPPPGRGGRVTNYGGFT
ncbi:heterogeneous nuclear ribonucleoprotein F-like [Symsagittifera roscoffensis]|uniref:heterogeneous nuclear ribonucleoprotein F-like n=1 Tax=Symsagittifera roscoffensis TaxID=84072 RepID=UPI00307B6801